MNSGWFYEPFATIAELKDSTQVGIETQKLSGIAASLRRLRFRIETGSFTRFDSTISLLVAILVYVAVTFPSMSRQLWHDELFTYYIAKTPSLSKLFQFKNLGIDLHPPLSYLLVRGSLTVLGDSAFATRVPYVIAFLVGSLCIYKFVSQRLRPAYGLLAMLVFWSTPFFSYATEARPYALVVAFFGIAMLAWTRAIQPLRSKSSVVMLALAVLGMMFSHLFSVFYIFPFCLAELWRWYAQRKFDWAIWMALLLPAAVPFFYLSQVHSYEAGAFAPVQQASPFKVLTFFYNTLQPEGFVLLIAVLVGLAVAFRRERQETERTSFMKPVEVAFTVGLLLLPAVLVTALIVIHGAYFPRYGILALIAYSLLIAFFMAIYTNVNRLAAAAASVILLASICGSTIVFRMLNTLRTWGRTTTATVHTAPIEKMRPDLPLVAASGLTFLEMDKYESPATVSRLYYLSDRNLALRYAHATIFEGVFVTLNRHFPIRAKAVPYRQFVAEHPHFLVVGTPDYSEDWLLRRLLDIHAKLEYLGNFPIPYKDTEIFEVTMPPSE